ncbi:MAG: branched-chain amino acid ABC transporter permease [Caldilineae bacterium]|nr:MAG: branched-chain amino acid ABC transporter permease [Caldilineae bacterium]
MSPELVLFLQTLVSGILIGFVFSLLSVGLTLIFGVMDIVNFAHGEHLMLAMYATFWMWTLWGIDPLFSLPVVALLLFILGVITYRLLIRYVLDAPMLAQIFVTFGLMVFLRNLAQVLWSEDYRRIGDTLLSGRIELFGIFIGRPQLFASLGAVITTGLLYFFLKRTRTGWALEATAEDKEVAGLMGINTERMFALAWGLGLASVGVAGALLATFNPIFPEVGTVFVLVTFVAVALGGFGSVPGAFIAGIIIGIVQVLGGFLWEPRFKTVLIYAIYLGVVFIRPQGLLGRR